MKSVLVTGASSGLGKAIYDALPGLGYQGTGVSRRGPDLVVDFGGLVAIHKLVKPQLLWDHAVLNHGILSFEENDPFVQKRIRDVNFGSIFDFLQRQATHGDLVRQGGSITINASVSGVLGDKDVPYYAALKAALINLTLSYAQILNEQMIRVNAFSCGFFKTNLVPGDTPPELIAKIPMKREAEASEIVPVVRMLIECDYITGQNVVVDGGLSL